MDRVRSSDTCSAYLFNVARRRYPSCNDKKSTRVPLSIVTYTRGIWTNSDIHLRSYLSLFRNLGDIILCGDRSWRKRGQKWSQFRLESLLMKRHERDSSLWPLKVLHLNSDSRDSKLLKTILGPFQQSDTSVELEVCPAIGLYHFTFGIPDLQCVAIEPHPL